MYPRAKKPADAPCPVSKYQTYRDITFSQALKSLPSYSVEAWPTKKNGNTTHSSSPLFFLFRKKPKEPQKRGATNPKFLIPCPYVHTPYLCTYPYLWSRGTTQTQKQQQQQRPRQHDGVNPMSVQGCTRQCNRKRPRSGIALAMHEGVISDRPGISQGL